MITLLIKQKLKSTPFEFWQVCFQVCMNSAWSIFSIWSLWFSSEELFFHMLFTVSGLSMLICRHKVLLAHFRSKKGWDVLLRRNTEGKVAMEIKVRQCQH